MFNINLDKIHVKNLKYNINIKDDVNQLNTKIKRIIVHSKNFMNYMSINKIEPEKIFPQINSSRNMHQRNKSSMDQINPFFCTNSNFITPCYSHRNEPNVIKDSLFTTANRTMNLLPQRKNLSVQSQEKDKQTTKDNFFSSVTNYIQNVNFEAFDISSLLASLTTHKTSFKDKIQWVMERSGNRAHSYVKDIKGLTNEMNITIMAKSISITFYEKPNKVVYEISIPFIYLILLYSVDESEMLKSLLLCLTYNRTKKSIMFNDSRLIEIMSSHKKSNSDRKNRLSNKYKYVWIMNDKIYDIVIRYIYMINPKNASD